MLDSNLTYNLVICFSWQPIMDYIDSKYEEYLNAESRVIRKSHITDNRVHCCLYFITPTGHKFVNSFFMFFIL